MLETKKRPYHSKARDAKARETKIRILNAAKTLFESQGFEHVTIEKIALTATVSMPTIYSLYQSKLGVLRALIDNAFPHEEFEFLVEKSIIEKSPIIRLSLSAKIARQMYDAEKVQMSIFEGAALLAPEFRELEKERERRRYDRQEVTITAMVKESSLISGLSKAKARDILWALTGRDIYRMFVIEQGWSSEEYEKWLSQLLIKNLVKESFST